MPTLGEDGRWDAVEDGTAEYRTRILVVRPADPARCNGTAVVHWLNVTAGYEKGTADDEELLSGFVWVGVSAQQVGIDGRPPARRRRPGRSLPETRSRCGTRSGTGRSCTPATSSPTTSSRRPAR